MSEVKFRDDVIIHDGLDFDGLVDDGLIENKIKTFLKNEVIESIDDGTLDYIVENMYDVLYEYTPEG